MGNSKKLAKDKTIHANLAGADRALCSKSKTRRITEDPAEVTCLACGRMALALVERAAAEAEARESETVLGRQAAALAGAQPPRWWESRPGAGEPGEQG